MEPETKPTMRECVAHWTDYLGKTLEVDSMKAVLGAGIISGVVILAKVLDLPIPDAVKERAAGITATVVFIWSFGYLLFWLPFLEIRALRRARGAAEAKLESIQKPELEIECGEIAGSTTRDWPVPYPATGPVGKVGQIILHTDFFGFRLINKGTTTLKNCVACITKIDRVGSAEKWEKQISMSFEPRSSTIQEPLLSVDLFNNLPQSVCVCSVRDDLVGHAIMASSVNLTSRYVGMFEKFFEKPGRFVFHVSISADDFADSPRRFLFDWGGNRKDSSITYPQA